jgi:hypothetical protein
MHTRRLVFRTMSKRTNDDDGLATVIAAAEGGKKRKGRTLDDSDDSEGDEEATSRAVVASTSAKAQRKSDSSAVDDVVALDHTPATGSSSMLIKIGSMVVGGFAKSCRNSPKIFQGAIFTVEKEPDNIRDEKAINVRHGGLLYGHIATYLGKNLEETMDAHAVYALLLRHDCVIGGILTAPESRRNREGYAFDLTVRCDPSKVEIVRAELDDMQIVYTNVL